MGPTLIKFLCQIGVVGYALGVAATPANADIGSAEAAKVVADLHGNRGYITRVDPIQINGKPHYRVEFNDRGERQLYTIDAESGELLY